MLYDNKPVNIEITCIFQYYGALKIEHTGYEKEFEEFKDSIYYSSQEMCEQCGCKAEQTIINSWETTLCEEHFNKIEAKEKYGYF